MNRYIKIQLLKDGKPLSPTLYTYKTSLDVQLGEVVQATEKLQGVVAGFEVISNIEHPEKIKEIVAQIPSGTKRFNVICTDGYTRIIEAEPINALTKMIGVVDEDGVEHEVMTVTEIKDIIGQIKREESE